MTIKMIQIMMLPIKYNLSNKLYNKYILKNIKRKRFYKQNFDIITCFLTIFLKCNYLKRKHDAFKNTNCTQSFISTVPCGVLAYIHQQSIKEKTSPYIVYEFNYTLTQTKKNMPTIVLSTESYKGVFKTQHITHEEGIITPVDPSLFQENPYVTFYLQQDDITETLINNSSINSVINSHNPLAGRFCRFISETDANGNAQAQYFVPTNEKKKIPESQVNSYGSQIKPDIKQQPYIDKHTKTYDQD